VRVVIVVVDTELNQERRYEFDKAEITLGRTEDNDVVLPAGTVSRRHARAVVQDGRLFIVDLKTSNGTWRNRQKIIAPARWLRDDHISISRFELRAELIDPTAAATPEATPYRSPPSPVEQPVFSLTSAASPLGTTLTWAVRWRDERGSQRVTSSARTARIGSDPSCEVCVSDATLPAECARIEQREGFVFVIGTAKVALTIQGRPLLVPTLWNVGESLSIVSHTLERVEP
jgi:hypothetical protein